MAALTSLLVEIIARQQVLRRQHIVDRAFAHDSETIGGHLDRGYGPGCAAPALVDRPRDVFSPDFTGVIRPPQLTPLERGFQRLHLQNLNNTLQLKICICHIHLDNYTSAGRTEFESLTKHYSIL